MSALMEMEMPEIPRCRCGYPMQEINSTGVWFCPRHDRLTDEELQPGGKRKVGHYDTAFERAWKSFLDEQFPEQKGKKLK